MVAGGGGGSGSKSSSLSTDDVGSIGVKFDGSRKRVIIDINQKLDQICRCILLSSSNLTIGSL